MGSSKHRTNRANGIGGLLSGATQPKIAVLDANAGSDDLRAKLAALNAFSQVDRIQVASGTAPAVGTLLDFGF